MWIVTTYVLVSDRTIFRCHLYIVRDCSMNPSVGYSANTITYPILDFQVIAKVGGKYSGCYQLIGGEKVPVQKVNRVYACKNKGYGKIYKTHATTGKDAKVPSLPDHCIVDNNNELSIDVVDREWYVKLAKEQIRKFLGVKAPRKNTRKINSLKKKSLALFN